VEWYRGLTFLMSYAACYMKEIYVVISISDRELSQPEPSAKQIAKKEFIPTTANSGQGDHPGGRPINSSHLPFH
jgi:hypothetical protein